MLSEITKQVLRDILNESGNAHLVDENGEEVQLLSLLLKIRDQMALTSPTLKYTVHASTTPGAIEKANKLLPKSTV